MESDKNLKTLDEKLKNAAVEGNTEEVGKLLTEGVKVDTIDKEGYTSLMLASRWGNVDCVKILLKQGAKVNHQNNFGMTSLMWASVAGKVQCVTALLKRGADANIQDRNKYTALMLASRDGNADCVRVLLDRGAAQIDHQNMFGWTSLMKAAENGHAECVRVLIERGAQANMKNIDNRTALEFASKHVNRDCIIILLSVPGIELNTWNPLPYPVPDDLLKVYPMLERNTSSFTKVVLCGNTGAGKTALAQMIIHLAQVVIDTDDKSRAQRRALQSLQPRILTARVRNDPIEGILYDTLQYSPAMSTEVEEKRRKHHNSKRVALFESTIKLKNSGPVKRNTAGIIPRVIKSQWADIMLFDLAGHRQYYSSHCAVLKAISSTPSIFLLLVNMLLDFKHITSQLYYWSAMIDDVCHKCSKKSSVIVIGTHADGIHDRRRLKSIGEAIETVSYDAIQKHTFAGFIALNGTNFDTKNIEEFMSLLHQAKDTVNVQCPAISLDRNALITFLKCKVPTHQDVISLSQLLTLLEQVKPKVLLPIDANKIILLLKKLSEEGFIVFLESNIHMNDSWVFLHPKILLEKVNGVLFAPSSFKEHLPIVSNTGVISVAILRQHFPEPTYNIDVIISLFVSFELCVPITLTNVDTNMAPVGSPNTPTTELGPLIFIPACVNVDMPSSVIVTKEGQFEWLLCTTSINEFFTARCLHALTSRLIGHFALPTGKPPLVPLHDVYRRKCYVWSRGIFWMNEEGISVIVEMKDDFKCLSCTISASNGSSPVYLLSVIQVIKETCADFCPSRSLVEALMCPPEATLEHTSAIVEIRLLKAAIETKTTTVMDSTGKKEVFLSEWIKKEPLLFNMIGMEMKADIYVPSTTSPSPVDDDAAKVPAKWSAVAAQLGLSSEQICMPSDSDQLKDAMDCPCSVTHLVRIAKGLTDWEMVAYALGLSQAEVEEVDRMYETLPLKGTKMLMKWKNKLKGDATYQRIITAFSFLERHDMADRVLKVSTTPSSECAHLSSQLKTCYMYTNPNPDIWPPFSGGKVHTLNLIEVQSPAGACVKRVPILLQHIFDEDNSQKEATSKKVILIEGAPGSGKSTLLWHMRQKWASGELFQEFNFVVYIKLCEYSTAESLSSVADILPFSSDMKESAWEEINAANGKGVLFLLDGWDELQLSLQRNSIIKDIVNLSPKHSLPLSTVVITSRYMSSDEIRHLATSHLEIQGFTDLEIKEFIMNIRGNDEVATHALMTALESRPSLLSSCHLPLNAKIVSYVFKAKPEKLPSTMLGTYKLLILECIKRHVKKKEPHRDHCITSLERLPKELDVSFYSLCKLAFKGLMENRVLFSKDELCSIPDQLGLLYEEKLHEEDGQQIKYSFFHHIIQGLLAALYMSKLPPDNQLACFCSIFGQIRFDQMILFYAGVTSFQLTGIKSILDATIFSYSNRDDFNMNDDEFILACSPKQDLCQAPTESSDYCDQHYFSENREYIEMIRSVCEKEDNLIKQKLRSDEIELENITKMICDNSNADVEVEREGIYNMLKVLVAETKPSYSFGKEMLLLANCLYETADPTMYEMTNGLALKIINVPLLPSDCLSLGCLIAKSCIKDVVLLKCNLSPSCMKSFTVGFRGQPLFLEKLEFSSYSFDERSLSILSEWIVDIKALNLMLCNVGCKGLTCILLSLRGRSIEALGLNGSNVEVNESNGYLLQEFISWTPSLESLDLSENLQVSDVGAYYIGQALKFNNTLKHLDLSNCGITLVGAVALCDSLETNTGLTTLDLCHNDIGDHGKYLCHCLMGKKKTIEIYLDAIITSE